MKSHIPIRKIIVAAAICVVAFLISFSQILDPVDRIFSDPLLQGGEKADSRIKIIAIDEKTIQKYGNVSDWPRDRYAQLVSFLSADPEKAPAVLVFDIMFVSDKDADSDTLFATECKKAGNVITAINVVYKDDVNMVNGSLTVDKNHISMIEYPYGALKDASNYGFANTYIDRDGIIRYARTVMNRGDEEIASLSFAAYETYMKSLGKEAIRPQTTQTGFFTFQYTDTPGKGFEVLSFCDVLDGKIDAAAFRDSAVFVGAYAPGLQDAYGVPIDKGTQMYGVEIHANIFKALLEGNTAIPGSRALYAGITALIALLFFLVIDKMKIISATVTLVSLGAVCTIVPKVLFENGIEIRLIYPLLFILLIYTAKLVLEYILETVKKKRILNAFKKYVAPEVVDEISGKGDFSVKLGGEKRHIAVLFVDIRGFTPMSEGLEPEEVVEILNEYLDLTTKAIFKNKGTLDKFIGDATMAVFNAPFDLDDYVFRAVSAAVDIASGSEALEKKLMERFGKTVSFGIGVNCGHAIVGNIGCEYRMDYTAIGDTVNTAARLESNAKRGQILISQEVYDVVKDRVEAEEIGVIPLKGKSKDVFVYQLNEIKTAKEN